MQLSLVSLAGGEVYLLGTAKASLILMRSRVALITHSLMTDLNSWLVSGTYVVQLYHASFPIKKMGFDASVFYPKSLIKRFINSISYPSIYARASVAFASSDMTQTILSSAIGISKSKVHIYGYPRVDGLISKNETAEDIRKLNSMFFGKSYKNLIYYVPTFRTDKNFNFFDFDFDATELIKNLEECDAQLIVRFHPFDRQKYAAIENLLHPRIIIENHGLSDPYPLLKRADLLITDFSSIYADFLLLNRPIIFSAFDINGYLKNERPLYFSYDQITPGPKATNWIELNRHIRDLFIDGIDKFALERKAQRNLIFGDRVMGNNCEEITAYIYNRTA